MKLFLIMKERINCVTSLVLDSENLLGSKYFCVPRLGSNSFVFFRVSKDPLAPRLGSNSFVFFRVSKVSTSLMVLCSFEFRKIN